MGALIALACVGSGVQPEGADGACANEERRVEQGSAALALPDCRAYELVSPGSLLLTSAKPARASSDGNAFSYHTTAPASEAATSSLYHLARRGQGGWALATVGPQTVPGPDTGNECAQNLHLSHDFEAGILEEGWFEGPESELCKRAEDELVAGEPWPHRNVFSFDSPQGTYRLVNLTPPGAVPANAKFQDASGDFGRILFSEEARLTPEAPPGNNLYLWEDGEVRLVPHLPNGTPVSGELVEATTHRTNEGTIISGSGLAPVTGAVSRDGRRVLFYVGDGLYLRLNADMPQSPIESGECTDPQLACTVQVDATQGPGASGAGVFWRADEEAQSVLLTSERKLTADSTATSGKADLYRYDLASGDLTDLTPNPSEAADVRGVVAASEDLSRIYFLANGVLAPGAAPGNCRGAVDASQTCNLYLAEEGEIELVATLSRTDRAVWQESSTATSIPRRRSRALAATASSDGRFLAFASVRSLTGYDNRDATTSNPNRMIFLYDAEANEGEGELRCATCIPDGSRPEDATLNLALGVNYGPSLHTDNPGSNASWKRNSLLENGDLLFDTEDALLPTDTNGHRDVYLYRDGQHLLISSGTFAGHSRFLDASPSGSDVFLRTAEALLAADTDEGNPTVYDARIGGGFPQPPPHPESCEGEGCRVSVLAAPPISLPGTPAFRGPGNQAARKPAKQRRRCKGAGKRARKARCAKAKRKRAKRGARARVGR